MAARLPPTNNTKANYEKWEKKGSPLKVKEYIPRSSVDQPDAVIRQQNEIDEASIKFSEMLISEPGKIARVSTGVTAPPLILEDVEQIRTDSVKSSAWSDKQFAAYYARGNTIATIDKAQELSKAGAEIDRINRQERSEEELMVLKNEFMVLKGQSLELPEWNPEMFPPDGTAVFFGRRRAGKSWMMRYLLWLYQFIYAAVIVLTNTEQNEFWSKHIPHRFIHKYNPYIIEKILERQRAVLAHNKLHAANPDMLMNPYLAIILDDVVAKNMQHDPSLNALFYEGRHCAIGIFISTQHPKALPPGVRANADLAVVYPQTSEKDKETIRTQYCDFFEHKDDFNLLIRQSTQDRKCLVIFLGDPTATGIESLYTFKADDPGPFSCGSREFWIGDEEEYRKKLEAQAAMLTNKGASGNAASYSGNPDDMHWLVDDSETNALINAATFSW